MSVGFVGKNSIVDSGELPVRGRLSRVGGDKVVGQKRTGAEDDDVVLLCDLIHDGRRVLQVGRIRCVGAV